MNPRPGMALLLIAVLMICALGTFLVVNWPERQIDVPEASSRTRGDGPVEKAGVEHRGGRPSPQDQPAAESKPPSLRNPQLESFRAYLEMVQGVPWGSDPGRKKTDDGLEGVTKATLALARIRKRAAVEFAARLCEVLRKHDQAIPQELADAVEPEHTAGLPSLTLDDHEAVLTQSALVLWVASRNGREMQRRLRRLKLELAWDLLVCVAEDSPVGYARAMAAGEMLKLMLDGERLLPIDWNLRAPQVAAAIEDIWADALDVSGGRWTADSAVTLFALETIPLQGWLILKAISTDRVSRASLTRFVDDLTRRVRGLRQVDRAEGTDWVIQIYIEHVDGGLRKEIPLVVPSDEDKKEVDALVRGMVETLAASDELQRSVFGHECKTVDLLWYVGSVPNDEFYVAFEGRSADGKVSRVGCERSIRRTPAGLQ